MGRGELDGVVINTTGVGMARRVVRDCGLQAGDHLIITGTLADHGLAVLCQRKGIELAGELRSDVAPIMGMIANALEVGGDAIHAMKDPTRGGVASAVNEMAAKAGVGIVLDQDSLPLTDPVRAAAEVLGIDPLVVANEGKAVLGVAPEQSERVLAALRAHPLGAAAAMIGRVTDDHPGRVVLETGFGRRIVTEVEGEPLPRIC